MHTDPMADSDGVFGTWKPAVNGCHKCRGAVLYRLWSSHCGGYEDHQFECTACGYSWWVDGSDS